MWPKMVPSLLCICGNKKRGALVNHAPSSPTKEITKSASVSSSPTAVTAADQTSLASSVGDVRKTPSPREYTRPKQPQPGRPPQIQEPARPLPTRVDPDDMSFTSYFFHESVQGNDEDCASVDSASTFETDTWSFAVVSTHLINLEIVNIPQSGHSLACCCCL
jgi:hypothetical protein